MIINHKKNLYLLIILILPFFESEAQKLIPFKLPGTGQTGSYTSTHGEDSDFIINPPSFTDNGDGTLTDNITGLMWQKTDGGEITFEHASVYCKNVTLGGYNDWRLPASHELFSINNYNNLNPALNTTCFSTQAEYWWTSDTRVDDTARVWVVNAGGGIGPHPKTETISAGGNKKFHVRAVRDAFSSLFYVSHLADNGDGTITDNYTGLVWQKIQPADTMSWEGALAYANSLTLVGKNDWRLPNIKELQSLNDVKLYKPSFNKNFFVNTLSGNYWSSTTMFNTAAIAWDINIDYGIVSYNNKTVKEHVLLVRGGLDKKDLNITDVLIPGGEFQMGDHFGFVDPGHPSDETPVHLVKIDSFYMAKTITTNQQFLAYLNSSLLNGLIEVRNNIVYSKGGNDIYCYMNQFGSSNSIGYDGKVFSISDFRANHPVVGVMWFGAVAYCNWLSTQNGLDNCYNLTTWDCDFSKNGYRLPTEAEFEYAARGGHNNPYLNFVNGNTIDITTANLPNSGDPYETGSYPYTTPVGFYDGTLKIKSYYNWPGSAANYQTGNGINGFGLYDMQGNVWELIYDWYGQNYYNVSPYHNPNGPDSSFKMPDGLAYRGMRGGNWYNGRDTFGVNDGHSRVSNRDPSYYRGPLPQNDSWCVVGFRVARNLSGITGLKETEVNLPNTYKLLQNYPNPFNPVTSIKYYVPHTSSVSLKVFNILGQEVARLVDEVKNQAWYTIAWNGNSEASGIYFCTLSAGLHQSTIKMILIK